MKKITILFGNYGSGKTELALNIALDLGRDHKDVSLVDLDIVNPYFRSSEHKNMLESKGIRVIAPVYANTAVDLPTLPPDIYAAFEGGYAVFDCGGDPVGATALGSLKSHFDRVRADTLALYVVNTMRPFQDSADSIIQGFTQIQAAARIKADDFVLNTNLGSETTGDILVNGYGIIRELVKKAGVPLAYVSGTKESLGVFKKRCPDYTGGYITLEIFMRPYWM
ncbi:MAG: hypothetical protein PHO15_06185 [Eubacteriales bacterium]|nr:hypothetical protein [Eubacteriales bacterium]